MPLAGAVGALLLDIDDSEELALYHVLLSMATVSIVLLHRTMLKSLATARRQFFHNRKLPLKYSGASGRAPNFAAPAIAFLGGPADEARLVEHAAAVKSVKSFCAHLNKNGAAPQWKERTRSRQLSNFKVLCEVYVAKECPENFTDGQHDKPIFDKPGFADAFVRCCMGHFGGKNKAGDINDFCVEQRALMEKAEKAATAVAAVRCGVAVGQEALAAYAARSAPTGEPNAAAGPTVGDDVQRALAASEEEAERANAEQATIMATDAEKNNNPPDDTIPAWSATRSLDTAIGADLAQNPPVAADQEAAAQQHAAPEAAAPLSGDGTATVAPAGTEAPASDGAVTIATTQRRPARTSNFAAPSH